MFSASTKFATPDTVRSAWPAIGAALGLSLLCAIYLTVRADLVDSSKTLEIFNFLLLKDDPSGAWLTLSILIAALAWRNDAPITRLIQFIADHSGKLIFLTIAVLATGTLIIYHNHPLSMDEYAPWLQSKIFASGKLLGSYPAELLNWLVPMHFQGMFIANSKATGAIASQYWPGFALLLTPFQWLGVPWLCNPLLAGASLWLMRDIASTITGDKLAGAWAMLFAVASPAFMANGISYYSMSAHLTFNLAFVWLLLNPTPLRAAAAGVVGSVALALHNPFPHAVFALPWIVWLATDLKRLKSLFALLAGYVPLALLLIVGWMNIRNGLSAPTLEQISTAPIPSIFSRILGLLYFVNLPDAYIFFTRVAAAVKIWVWAVPGLLVFAALGYERFRQHPAVLLMMLSAVVTFLGYFLVPYDQGHGWGYRYFHSAWGVIPILAACLLAGGAPVSRRLIAFVGAATLLSLVLSNGLRAVQIEQYMSNHVGQVPRIEQPGKHILMIDLRRGYYAADLVQNDPFLRSDTLRMVSHGAVKNSEMMAARWPGARKISSGSWGELWQLGADESLR